MRNLIKLIVISLLAVIVTACGNDSKNQSKSDGDKGDVVISVDNKTYSLKIDLCEQPHEIKDKGEKIIVYTIAASSLDSNARLRINGWNGQKMKDANYDFSINGGVYDGGFSYMGDMPFEVFADKKLTYTGMTERSKKGMNDVTNIVIDIVATCL